jgi:hypothetical protein
MPKICYHQKTKLFKLYNKLEKILVDPSIFIPIENHNKIIRKIYEIEDNYLCLDTENCRHCKKIANHKSKYIDINGFKIRLSIWIENEMLQLVN